MKGVEPSGFRWDDKPTPLQDLKDVLAKEIDFQHETNQQKENDERITKSAERQQTQTSKQQKSETQRHHH